MPALTERRFAPFVPSPREVLQKYSAVIVTGGSSGIGKSFIELLVTMNPELMFCNLSRRAPDINNSQLKLRHFPCDLAQSGQLEQTVADIVAHLKEMAPAGRVLLINNSGFGAYGHFPAPDLRHNLELLDVNVRAVVHVTGLLLPTLKSRGGAIVTVASTAAFQPTACMSTYGASKAFVLHWSLALHEELRGSGVSALAVCPGPTATNFGARAGMGPGAVSGHFSQTCEEVVQASLRALAAGRAQVVSGWFNKLLVGVSSRLPKPLAARIGAIVLNRYRVKQVPR